MSNCLLFFLAIAGILSIPCTAVNAFAISEEIKALIYDCPSLLNDAEDSRKAIDGLKTESIVYAVDFAHRLSYLTNHDPLHARFERARHEDLISFAERQKEAYDVLIHLNCRATAERIKLGSEKKY